MHFSLNKYASHSIYHFNKKMNIRQKSQVAFKWEIIGKFTNPIIFLASTFFLARLLEPENFGQLAIIQVITLILISLLDLGFGVVLIQKQNINESHFSSVFWLCLFVSFVVSIALFLFSEKISMLLFNSSQLQDFIKATPVCLILSTYIHNQTSRLKKEMNFSTINISLILSAFLSGSIAVLLAYNGFGTWSLILQLILNYVFQAFILFLATKWQIKRTFSLKAIQNLWGMGKMMFIGNGIDIIYSHLDSLIIGKIFPSKTLGYYNRSKTLNTMVVNFTSGTLSFILPAFSLMQNDKEKLKSAFIYILHALCAVTFWLVGILYICAKDVIILAFGSKWLNSIDFFEILILGSYSYPLGALMVNLIISCGQSKVFIKNEIIKRIFLTTAIMVGFQFGINGYLYSLVILAFIGTSLNAHFACKSINISLFGFYKHVYKYLLVAIFLVIPFKIFDHYYTLNLWLHIFIVGILYSFFYLVLIYSFGLYGFEILKTEIGLFLTKKFNDR